MFKAINDRYGHRAGDMVIVEVARRLITVARASDTVARLGGDEFVVVLEGDGDEAAHRFAYRFREAIAAPVALPDGEEISVSISVGVATSDGTGPPQDLLVRADAVMYSHKRGR